MSVGSDFSFLLFSVQPAFIRRAVAAGVDGVIVDWECLGKEERQSAADTQINHDTVDDLRRVRACTDALVVCRLNRHGETTAEEVEQAIAAGADEILLPMVRSVEEVEAVIVLARERCGVGVLVETVAATDLVDALAALPLSRVYVGLNDLAIERGTPNIFTAVADGMLERVRRPFRVPFGFGGLTLPDRGYPIPCRLLIGEMARLDCTFSFLRRSFHRDIVGKDMDIEVQRMRAAMRQAAERSTDEVARDKRDLDLAIGEWCGEPSLARKTAHDA